ncbi:MAG: hypothetical protein WA661_17215, partial [Xanthobacteraceae bacterium]
FEGNLDGINQSSNGELQIESPGFNLFVGATTAPPSFDQVTEQLANSTDYFNDEASGEDTADLVNGTYNPAAMPVIPQPALASSDIYPDAESILDPMFAE